MINTQEERLMAKSYKQSVARLLQRREEFSQPGRQVGIESEVCLYHPDATEHELLAIRNAVVSEVGAAAELGGAQIELVTNPCDVMAASGFQAFAESYQHRWNRLKVAASRYGVYVMRCGTNPFQPCINPLRTNQEKYQRVPDFQNHFRNPFMETKVGLLGTQVDVGDASVISLMQSFQVNVEAKSIEHGLQMVNHSLMLSPYLLGISGNAGWLECTNTGYQDIRTHAWEISHDTRTLGEIKQGLCLRIGLPESYFATVKSYFARMARYPFIMFNPDKALDIAIGLNWLDARLKFIGSSAVVELRSISTQPSIADEIGIAALYLGWLHYANCVQMQLMPIEHVRENRYAAMLYGLKGKLWNACGKLVDATEAVNQELSNAVTGMKCLGIYDDAVSFVNPITERLCIGTPSDRLNNIAKPCIVLSNSEMLSALEEACMVSCYNELAAA